MSESKSITLKLDLDELMIEFMPKMAREFMRHTGTAEEFQGTEMSLVMDISGSEYSYILKDGSNLEAAKGALEKPLARVSLCLEDMEKLILMKNIDLFVGMPTDSVSQARKRQGTLEVVKGKIGMELTNDDGSVSKVSTVLNGAEEPHATFKLSMEDARQMMSGQANPVTMFMGGQLQIEGDIGFAMSLQPLFT